jgi:hypothetical protein
MAKVRAAFKVPADLEFFTGEEVEEICRFRRSKRQELTRQGKLDRVNVAGKWLYSGASVRRYLAACAA